MCGLLDELMEICHILNTRIYPVSFSESSTSNIFFNLNGAQKETSSPHAIHKIGWWVQQITLKCQ